MRANELMIGDLVDLSDVSGEIIPCEVVELHTDELYVILPNEKACDIVSYDMIRPIPLTAEILENNGFEGSPTEDMYLHIELWEQCQLKVEMYPSEGSSVFVYRDKTPIDMYASHVLLHINYVHELQHALRLCGLNDLADNFKLYRGNEENVENCLDSKKKWKPEHGHIMHYIDRNMDVDFMVCNMFNNDCLKLVKIGNCFETREDALNEREKIKKLLNISNK